MKKKSKYDTKTDTVIRSKGCRQGYNSGDLAVVVNSCKYKHNYPLALTRRRTVVTIRPLHFMYRKRADLDGENGAGSLSQYLLLTGDDLDVVSASSQARVIRHTNNEVFIIVMLTVRLPFDLLMCNFFALGAHTSHTNLVPSTYWRPAENICPAL